MNELINEWNSAGLLGRVTIVMTTLLSLAWFAKSLAYAFRAAAAKTETKTDDAIAAKLVAWAEAFDAFAQALGHLASAGIFAGRRPQTLNPTPHLEAVLGTPSAGNATEADPNDSTHRRLP